MAGSWYGPTNVRVMSGPNFDFGIFGFRMDVQHRGRQAAASRELCVRRARRPGRDLSYMDQETTPHRMCSRQIDRGDVRALWNSTRPRSASVVHARARSCAFFVGLQTDDRSDAPRITPGVSRLLPAPIPSTSNSNG